VDQQSELAQPMQQEFAQEFVAAMRNELKVKRNEKGINGNHYYLIDDRGQLKHLYTTDTGGDFNAALKAEDGPDLRKK